MKSIKEQSIISALEERACMQPDKQVFRFPGEKDNLNDNLTFGELYNKVADMSYFLRQNTTPGDRVLLMFNPGIDYIVAFLGCLDAGIIAVPIYPPRGNRYNARLLNIIKDCEPMFGLFNDDSGISLKMENIGNMKVLNIAHITPRPAQKSTRETISTDIAFLQYTSGSTGNPKGVKISHGNLISNLAAIADKFKTNSEVDSAVFWLPPYHDMGLIGGILAPVYSGLSVTLMSPMNFLKNPLLWLSTISDMGATISGGPNFAYDLCTAKIKENENIKLDLSNWQIAFCGAEPVRNLTLTRFSTAFEKYGFRSESFMPCYGLAEATLLVAGAARGCGWHNHSFDGDELKSGRAVKLFGKNKKSYKQQNLVSNGQIALDTTVYITDQVSGEILPEGRIGEICVEGPSVASGYWTNTENPVHAFSKNDEKMNLLHTGDLGFMLNGELFVNGRIKDLIIIRGINHYAQDIESTVEQSHPLFNGCMGAAFSIESKEESQLIVVFEINRKKETDYRELASLVRKSVAKEHEIQIKSLIFIRKGTLPRTSSGKVQRGTAKEEFKRGLLSVVYKESEGQNRKQNNNFQRPANKLEESLAKIFEKVLKYENAGRNDNFFEMGGDSLNVVEYVMELSNLDIDLDPETIYEYPSIAELAGFIEKLNSPAKSVKLAALTKAPDHEFYRLSPVQRRYWADYLVDLTRSWSNMYGKIEFVENASPDILQKIFNLLMERDESLRTAFPVIGGERVQLIGKNVEIPVDVIDVRNLDAPEQEKKIEELEHTVANFIFNLETAPLMKVTLVLANKKSFLLVNVHHMIADGHSLLRLRKEIIELYASYCSGKNPPIKRPSFQYRDYTNWINNLTNKNAFESAKKYWLRELSGNLPYECLPVDKRAAQGDDKRGCAVMGGVPQELMEKIQSISASNKTSYPIFLYALLFLIIHEQTGMCDIIIGTPLSGRDFPGLNDITGIFINLCMIRNKIDNRTTFIELLKNTQRKVLSAIKNQYYQLDQLVTDLNIKREDHRFPVTNMFYTHLSFSGNSPLKLKEKEIIFKEQITDVRFDMMWYANQYDDDLIIECKYRKALFTQSYAENLLKRFLKILENVVKNPDRPLSEYISSPITPT